jgi:hypothetical protein
VVGATGFEPATPCAQGRCATRLRYAPTPKILKCTAVSHRVLVRMHRPIHSTIDGTLKSPPRLGQKEEALELAERVFARGWGKRDWEHDRNCRLEIADFQIDRRINLQSAF